jgi:hypothetical protein
MLKALGVLIAIGIAVIICGYSLFDWSGDDSREKIVSTPTRCKPGERVLLQFPFGYVNDEAPATVFLILGRDEGSLYTHLTPLKDSIPMKKNTKVKMWEATVACPNDAGKYCAFTSGTEKTYTGRFVSLGK